MSRAANPDNSKKRRAADDDEEKGRQERCRHHPFRGIIGSGGDGRLCDGRHPRGG
jgi:hypothetical protein